MRKRANGVEPGLRDLADDEDLDGAYLAHRDADFNAGDLAHPAFDEFLGLAEGEAADLDRSDVLHHHGAVAIDFEFDGLVDAAPVVDVQFVIGSDNIVVTDGNVADRSER